MPALNCFGLVWGLFSAWGLPVLVQESDATSVVGRATRAPDVNTKPLVCSLG